MADNSPLKKFDVWGAKGLLTAIPSEKRATGYTGSQTDYFFASYFNTIVNEIDSRRNTMIDTINHLLETSATAWLPTTSYQQNAVVTKDGWLYIAKQNNSNATPNLTDENWAQIARVAEVEAGLALKANIDSPTLTGEPKTITLGEDAGQKTIVNVEWLKRYASNNIMRGISTIDLNTQDKAKAYPVILAKNAVLTNTTIYKASDATSGNMFLQVQALPSNSGKNNPIIKIENAVDNTEKEHKRFVLGVEWKDEYPFVVVYLRGGFTYNIVQRSNDPMFEVLTQNSNVLTHAIEVKDFSEDKSLGKFFWESYDKPSNFATWDTLSLVNWDLEDYNKYITGEKVQQQYKLMKMEISNFTRQGAEVVPSTTTNITYLEDAVGLDMTKRWEWVGAYPCVVEVQAGELKEIQKLNPSNYAKTLEGENADITTLGKDVVMKFRRLGYRYIPKGSNICIYLTDEPHHPAFRYDAFELENIHPHDKRAERFYVGAYLAHINNNKPYSASGKEPTPKRITEFCELCGNRSTNYNEIAYGAWHISTVSFLRMLLLFVGGSRDTRGTFGLSYAEIGTTGIANEYGVNNELTGSTDKKDYTRVVKALGLEALWGDFSVNISGIKALNRDVLALYPKDIAFSAVLNTGGKLYQNSFGRRMIVSGNLYAPKIIGMGGNEDLPFLPSVFSKIDTTTEDKENTGGWQGFAENDETFFSVGYVSLFSMNSSAITANRLLIV